MQNCVLLVEGYVVTGFVMSMTVALLAHSWWTYYMGESRTIDFQSLLFIYQDVTEVQALLQQYDDLKFWWKMLHLFCGVESGVLLAILCGIVQITICCKAELSHSDTLLAGRISQDGTIEFFLKSLCLLLSVPLVLYCKENLLILPTVI